MADPFSGGIMPQVIQNMQGLQSIQASQQDMQMRREEQQRQQKKQADEAKAAEYLAQYQASEQSGTPDFTSLNKAILLSPTASQNVLTGIGIQDKRQKTQAASDVVSLYAAADSPEKFKQLIANRIQTVRDRGGDPKDSIELANIYETQGAEAARKSLQMVGAALANEGFVKADMIGLQDAQQRGVPSSQAEMEYYLKLQKENPEAAAKFAKARGYTDSPREQAETPQEKNLKRYEQMIADGNPNAEAFAISSGLKSKEGRELSATSQTEVVKALEAAELNGVNVTKYMDLASRFKESDIAGGLAGTGGSWREALKTATGSQDEVSKIVGDWQKIRSGEAIASLPQGPATDADIALALKPLPENANAEYMDMYLRGLAKTAEYKQRYAQAKANFITENGSLRAKDGTNFGKVWGEQRLAVLDEIKADPRFMAQQAKPAQQAPAQAVEYLRQNPQFAEQFKAKYGYLPEGM